MTSRTETRPLAEDRLSIAEKPREAKRALAPPSREYFFDNAKFFAIVLVVVAHSWEPLIDGSRATEALYMVIYTFHMPAFIVISGYFSRSFDGRADRLQRLVTGVLVPYLVFETAYGLYDRYIGGHRNHEISLLDPWFLTWFLIALFIWRLTAPIWRLVRWPIPLALAIAVLAATSKIGDDLDLQRVLQFLPFFVVGLCLKPEHFSMVRSWRVRLSMVPVFAGALVFAYWAAPRTTLEWFFRRANADDLGVSIPVLVVTMLVFFACSLILVAGFFSWVPGRRLWVTNMGAMTLYVYLLHGLVIKTSQYSHWYDNPFVDTPKGRVAVTLIAVGVAVVLGTPPVKWMFRPLIEPRLDWAFQRRGGARRPAERGARPTPTNATLPRRN